MSVFVFSVRRHLWQTIKIGQVPRVISYYIKMKDSLYLGIFSSIFLRIGTKWERLYLNTKILKFLWNIWKKALHKTCENTGFHWPIFSRIRKKSSILSLYGGTQVSENPHSRMFYAVKVWNGDPVFNLTFSKFFKAVSKQYITTKQQQKVLNLKPCIFFRANIWSSIIFPRFEDLSLDIKRPYLYTIFQRR